MARKWVRQAAAGVLAALTVVTAGAVEQRGVTVEGSALKWLLARTLESRMPPDDLSGAAMLALGQSPLLLAARWNVAAAGDEAAQPEDGAAPEPEAPQETAAPSPAITPLPVADRPALAFLDNGVPSQTVKITNTAGYTVVRGVCIKNASNKTLDAAALAAEDFAARLTGDAPQVLILHTHGSEAYTMPEGQEYVSTGTFRTADGSVSVIRVGDEIAAALSQHGISVLHDRALYDDPEYNGAYYRAEDAIEAYLEKYPSISFILDVHRDALEDKAGHQYKVITREDPSCAQVSLVMGSSWEGWQENLKLAVAVQQHLTDQYPTLMRPVTVRNSDYNEYFTPGSLLVEVGAAGNSLDEALAAARLFAHGFAEVVTGT